MVVAAIDDLIDELFSIQESLWPDEDPGDLSIDVQDDMPLVLIQQWGRPPPQEVFTVVRGSWMGSKVQDVLLQMIEYYKSLDKGAPE